MKTILALDVTDLSQLRAFCALAPQTALSHVKIGHVALSRFGIEVIRDLVGATPLFLDLKFFDIPHTVGQAVEGYGTWFRSLDFFTVWGTASKAMLASARAASSARMLAVLQLTSQEPEEASFLAQAASALENGADGLICPVSMAVSLRKRFGAKPLLVSPGIRASAASDDQMATAAPAAAQAAGVDYIVVGRPILGAADPRKAIKEYTL